MVDIEKNDLGDSARERPIRGAFDDSIDYKNVGLLSRCLSEGGRIIPSRVTGTPFKTQRKKRRAILRARFLGLLPYVRK